MSLFFIWSLFLIFLLGSFCVIAMVIYAKLFKPQKTKESFAFFAAGLVLTLITNCFTVIEGNSFFLNLLGSFCSKFGNVPLPPDPSNFDKGLVSLLTVIFIGFILYLYKNWSLTMSTIEAKQLRLGNGRIGLIQGLKLNTKIVRKQIHIEIYEEEDQEDQEIFQDFDNQKLPFHIQVGQLLNLIDQQYEIDLGDYDLSKNSILLSDNINFGKDWHNQEQCFVTNYGKDAHKIVIFCPEIEPTIEAFKKLKKFTQTIKRDIYKIIIITENKLSNKYADASLSSYDIDKYSKEDLLDKLVNFRSYKKYLNKVFYNSLLPNSSLTLGDTYTPLSAKEGTLKNQEIVWNKDSIIDNVENYVLNWVKEENTHNQHLAILGEYGQGKSVLSQKICIEILENSNAYNRIPIIIELRGISPRNMDIISLLGHFGNQHAITAQSLYQLHKAGRLLIILEAFDEMDLVGDTEILMAHFQQLWQFARTPKSKIIITGRPNLFIDKQRRRRALGVNEPRDFLPYTHAIHLEPMNEKQIEKVLRSSPQSTYNQILGALNETGLDSNFGELVQRPSTLFQLSVIWNKDFEEKGVERINAAAVIEKFIQNDYDRQEAKFLSQGEKPFITADERSYFMMGIAVGMMLRDGYSNQISKKQLKEIIQRLYSNFPPNLPPYKDASRGILNSNLLERLEENKYAFETVLSDVLASGILVLDLSGADFFKFSHKSYLELLVSRFYINYILKEEEDEYEAMITFAIKKVFDFKENSLIHSLDVNNFVAQFIANRIKIDEDKQGKTLSISENEEQYARQIYKKLFPKFYSLFFPKLQSWLSFHPKMLRLQFLSLFLLMFASFSTLPFFNFPIAPIISSFLIIAYCYVLNVFNFKTLHSPLQLDKKNSYQQRLELFNLTLYQLRIKKTSSLISPIVLKILKTNELDFIDLANGISIIKLFYINFFFFIASFLGFLMFIPTFLINDPFTFDAFIVIAILQLLLIFLYTIITPKKVDFSFSIKKGTNKFILVRTFDNFINIWDNIVRVFIEKGAIPIIAVIAFLFLGNKTPNNSYQSSLLPDWGPIILFILVFLHIKIFFIIKEIKKL